MGLLESRCPQAIQCNTTQTPISVAGGQSPITDMRLVPTGGVKQYTLTYDAFTIPDRFFVTNPIDGSVIYDTGFTGTPGTCDNIPDLVVSGTGAGSKTIAVPKGAPAIAINVDSPCTGTAWTYSIACTPTGGGT